MACSTAPGSGLRQVLSCAPYVFAAAMLREARSRAGAPFCSSHTRASQPPALCACAPCVVSLEARSKRRGAATAPHHERHPALPRRGARVGHGGGHALQVPGGAAGAAGVGAGASAPGPRVRRTSPPSAWGTARRANRPGRPRPPRCAASPGETPAQARPALSSRYRAALALTARLRGAHDGAQLRLQRRAQRHVVLRSVAQAWQDDDRGRRCGAGGCGDNTRCAAAAQRGASRSAVRRVTRRATRGRWGRQHGAGGVAGLQECSSALR